MKRMGNHGSIGSQHQIQAGMGSMGSNQILGSGQNIMSESYQQGKNGAFAVYAENKKVATSFLFHRHQNVSLLRL